MVRNFYFREIGGTSHATITAGSEPDAWKLLQEMMDRQRKEFEAHYPNTVLRGKWSTAKEYWFLERTGPEQRL